VLKADKSPLVSAGISRFYFLGLLMLASLISLGAAQPARANESLLVCGAGSNNIFSAFSAYGIRAVNSCPFGPLSLHASGGPYNAGDGAIWQANAPAGLEIVGASIPMNALVSDYVNDGSVGQYGGDFYWDGGRSNIVPGEHQATLGPFASRVFGFLLVCGRRTCSSSNGPGDISVYEMTVEVSETTSPSLDSPTGVWATRGWVRGKWPLIFTGDSPSGMCGLVAYFANHSLPGVTSPRDPSVWKQCSAPPLNDEVITQGDPNGPQPLDISGWDAAGETVDQTKTIWVDNQPPTVSLSGPTDAPATATQYVTATAAAGPSGVGGISCSVDGGTPQWYPSSTVQVPVDGVGMHQVACRSVNNAIDQNGNDGSSPVETYGIKLGVPTVTGVAFSKLVDKLRCHRAITRTRHGRRRTVTRCHVRSVRRRVTVWVTVRRHGRKVRVRRHRIIRVLLKPHVVNQSRRLVGHGRATTVDGWLGTTSGLALGGQAVDVLTAADNGRNNFKVAARATTAADGSWSARLPAGPSRLVEAYYGGSLTTEGSQSAPVRLVVRGKVELSSVWPRRVAWGGTVRLTGRLVGGYLPPGGALVRLRIGLGSAVTTYGVREHVGGRGRFSTTYTFGAGDPGVHRSFWFQVATLPMGDYPYAPAGSRRLSVVVGGHPAPPHRR
jgi:hypothetical protein